MKQRPTISIKAILIGLMLMPVTVYLAALEEMIWHSLHWTSMSLPQLSVFILIVLLGANHTLQAVFKRDFLSPMDLLTIYAMLSSSLAFTAHDNMVCLMGVLPHGFWFATPENDWANLFHQYLPEWLTIRHPAAVRDFYKGESSFWNPVYISSWLRPALSWSALVLVLFFMLLCLNVIWRKQWIERERLAYPIIQIPLEITQTVGFLRNRVLWLGFSVAATIAIVNGLNFLYPTVPRIPIKEGSYDLGRFFTEKPWNAIGSMPIRFYPFLIGLSFLIPLDMTFSTWFFYLFRKWERVFGRIVGWESIPRYPFFGEQATGALLGICLLAVYTSRQHLKQVFRTVFAMKGAVDDSEEPIRYRTAVIGFIAGVAFLIFFCRSFGMSLVIILAFFALYFAIATALTRMRAELGPPLHAIVLVNPQTVLIEALGTRSLGTANLTMFALFYWFNRFNRSHPSPHQLEAFKLAERTQTDPKRLVPALLLAMGVGVIATFVIYPYTLYKYGASTAGELLGAGWQAYNNLGGWLQYSRPVDPISSAVTLGSLLFTTALMWMRMRFVWWPLHPAGYVLGVSSGTIDVYWFALFLCWAIKYAVLRFGGVKSYRKVLPFFMGLVLGDFVIGTYWGLLSIIVGTPLYTTWF